MRLRSLFPAACVAGVVALACLAACAPRTDPNETQHVHDVFDSFKAALGAAHAQQALDRLDQPSRNYLQSSVTDKIDPTASDEEVRELIRQTATKLTPGGVQPGFTLATPLQRVLDAGWINAQDIKELDLGPITIRGDEAHAELMWRGDPTTLTLVFVRESGAWKIDLLELVAYAELALNADRTVKGETESEQIARLVGQVPAP